MSHRCEKAAIHMKAIGIEYVYQFEGGILKYFEETGGAHYQGDCFVFDEREAVSADLENTGSWKTQGQKTQGQALPFAGAETLTLAAAQKNTGSGLAFC